LEYLSATGASVGEIGGRLIQKRWRLASRHFRYKGCLMYQSTGIVTEVQAFSDTEDQITIEITIPEPLGETGETHSHDWIVPKGQATVGDVVSVAINPPNSSKPH
jgi:hypothetical protein